MKTNQAKRQQADEELLDLQTRIDNFVSPIVQGTCVDVVLIIRSPPTHWRHSVSYLSHAEH